MTIADRLKLVMRRYINKENRRVNRIMEKSKSFVIVGQIKDLTLERIKLAWHRAGMEGMETELPE